MVSTTPMKQIVPKIVLLIITTIFAITPVYGDERVYGVWNTVEYNIAGSVVPMKGLMIITPGYFISNTVFDADGDGKPDANANSGSITIEDGKIKMQQWMQLHWRSNGEDHFLKEDIPEDINYTVEDNRLIFHFPSGNAYISERLSGFVE